MLELADLAGITPRMKPRAWNGPLAYAPWVSHLNEALEQAFVRTNASSSKRSRPLRMRITTSRSKADAREGLNSANKIKSMDLDQEYENPCKMT